HASLVAGRGAAGGVAELVAMDVGSERSLRMLDDGAGVASRRVRLAEEMAVALRRLAVGRPFVAVLEDIDRADAGTIDVLEALLRQAESEPAPLLIVATARDERVDEALSARLRQWQESPSCREVVLRPLDRDGLRGLL